MSHSTICNTTVSTKKPRPTLVKKVRKLRVTLYTCKGNAPVIVNKDMRHEEYVCLCKQSSVDMGMSVYIGILSLFNCPVDSYL